MGGAWKLRIEGARCMFSYHAITGENNLKYTIPEAVQVQEERNARSCSLELSKLHKCFLYHLNIRISTAGLLVEKQRQGEKWTLVRAAFGTIAHKQSSLS